MNTIRQRAFAKWWSSHAACRWALGFVWLLVSHSALAQSDTRPASADYQQLIDRGLAAYAAQHPAEARSFFAQAHALQPGARTLRALGIADLALDNFTMAKDELSAALKEQVAPLDDSQRAEVQELLRWMEKNLGVLHLSFTPLDAEASIDGRTVKVPEVLLAPEKHRLSISARGFVPQERTFTVTIDRPMRLEISLERAPAAISAAETKPAPPVVIERSPELQQPRAAQVESGPKLWPWLGGAGAVLLVTGGTLFAFGMSDKATVENAKSPVRLSEIEAAHNRVPWLTGVGLSLGVVGLAGVGAAAVLLLTNREPKQDLAWSLDAGPTNLSLTGRF
jgi:hypothetical protein